MVPEAGRAVIRVSAGLASPEASLPGRQTATSTWAPTDLSSVRPRPRCLFLFSGTPVTLDQGATLRTPSSLLQHLCEGPVS